MVSKVTNAAYEESIEKYGIYIEKARKILGKETLLNALETYSRDIFNYEKISD